MNEKKWGITLIITSVLLVTAISLLFFTLKAENITQTAQWGVRIFAIAACVAQFVVFVSFARAYKKSRKGWLDGEGSAENDVRGEREKRR
jgi:hypothetical protein